MTADDTKILRRDHHTRVDAYARDDASPTTVDGAALPGRRVAAALRAIPDWSIGAETMRATYAADVLVDGVWAALADLSDLSGEDLALECA